MFRRSTVALSTAWRDQGISYLKYLNICTDALHSAVKEKSAPKYVKFSVPNYITQEADGAGGFVKVEKVPDTIDKY